MTPNTTPARRALRAAPRWLAASLVAAALVAAALPCGAGDLPRRLHDTGLYAADGTIAPDVAAFSPQYPLWTDGAAKRRWLRLPPGTAIDASAADAWVFPRGTRLWKEFSHGGRPVETRLVERAADGGWRFATYVWNADATDAVLAPAAGAELAVATAPGGRYRLPSRADCLACHGSAAVPVLGFAALQLSPDRDPLAPHARAPAAGELDLRALAARGWLRGLPPALLEKAPRIAAATPTERAALGYLHANCAHCHNASPNRVPVRLTLDQSAADPAASRERALRSSVDAFSRYLPPGHDDAHVIVPGRAEHSVLALRMASRHPRVQMPPLGTEWTDAEGLALVHRWITNLNPPKEPRP